MSVRTSTTH
ncbi:hypothetical protein IEO21_10774 [Rhodonia placenta]|uniref:Uncharacterized protein n=1 Tax=Rhodonia placenta TaxID=104341 RepID=A0A8H7NRR6_9APHY|nr:hypothetical protein IEO21_10774 [Postia placenta]